MMSTDMKFYKAYDTSQELFLVPYKDGIKLMPIQRMKQIPISEVNNNITVSSILASSINVIFLNRESVIQHINENNAETLGYDSKEQALGKSIRQSYQRKAAEFSITHDLEVMKNQQRSVKEESCLRFDGAIFHCITAKIPLYNASSELIGLVGYSIPIGLKIINLEDKLQYFNKLVYANSTKYTQQETRLTTRESEILHYLVRGYSAKSTAARLNISFRTVESHIDNIKTKLDVETKAELINKVISNFL